MSAQIPVNEPTNTIQEQAEQILRANKESIPTTETSASTLKAITEAIEEDIRNSLF